MYCVANDSRVESLSSTASQHDDQIVQQAIALLEQRVFKNGPRLERPQAVKDYLRLRLVSEPNEVFAILFMNSQHEVLAYETLFRGTVDSTTVYPRVVLQRVLDVNAAAVILAHQHPSGSTGPSSADLAVTDQLKSALALIDVRVLDHIIVGQGAPFSFAESGLL